MYVIIWEYEVKAEHVDVFEKIYRADGAWAELFQKESGYLGTELLRHGKNRQHYITIDRWISARAYDDFLVNYQNEYMILDAECNELTKSENLLGKWQTVDHETR